MRSGSTTKVLVFNLVRYATGGRVDSTPLVMERGDDDGRELRMRLDR